MATSRRETPDLRVDFVDMSKVDQNCLALQKTIAGPADPRVDAAISIVVNDHRSIAKERVRTALFGDKKFENDQPNVPIISPKAQSVVICDGASAENRIGSFEDRLKATVSGIINHQKLIDEQAKKSASNISNRPVRRYFPVEIDRHVMGFKTIFLRKARRGFLHADEQEQIMQHMQIILDYLEKK
jgi:hypothetical protein